MTDPDSKPGSDADTEVVAVRTGGATWADGTGPDDDRVAAEAVLEQKAAADAEPGEEVPRVGGPAPRPPMLAQGLTAALLVGLLALASSFGSAPLLVLLLVVQLVLALGFLAVVDAPASGGIFLVVLPVTVLADVVALRGDGGVSGLAGVTALALVASLLHQLVRRGRSRVTESLADTLVVVVLVTGLACLIALRALPGGPEAVLVALAATAGALLAGRIGDRIAPRPFLAVGATRGWPGMVLSLGAGALCGSIAAGSSGEVVGRDGFLLGLVVAVAAAAADLAVDLGAAELRAGWRDSRRVAALRPLALLLPVAAVAPVAFVAGRLVLA